MDRSRRFIAVASAFAAFVSVTGAQAQQNGATNNRLMFDPSGMQGSEARKFTPQPTSPATGQSTTTTTGQSAPREAAPVRQTAAPQSTTAKPAAAAKRATAAKPAPRTAASAPPARGVQQSAAPNQQTSTARTSDRPIPREQPAALGRLDLSGGSIGYEGRTQMQAYDLGDGRRVPGYDNIQRNDSSYFGLSLRMPTSSSGSGSLFGRHGVD